MFDCVAGNGSERGGEGSRKENPDSSPTGPGCARTFGEDEKSGVTGDCHAPFRGSPGVKFPGATRLSIYHLRPFAAVLGLDSLTNREPDRRAAAIDADTGSGTPQPDPAKVAQTAHPL